MVEGLAEYREPDKEPYRVMVSEKTIKSMDTTFPGKPVYVMHVDDVPNLENADGFVVESFFNKVDGKHWAKFVVITQHGLEAIQKGWVLSNAYLPSTQDTNGTWHGIDYHKEVLSGVYEHLAIVPDPRYAESVILTPDQFKEYCREKEQEITRLSNSKEKKNMGFKLFEKKALTNSVDIEGMSVVLPKSKVEITIANALTELDTIKNMNGYANGEHMVKVGDKEMSVNELSEKYNSMCAEDEKRKNSESEGEELENEGDDDAMENEADELEASAMGDKVSKDAARKATANEEDKDEKKKNSKENFKKLANAHKKIENASEDVDLGMDQLARGQSLFGSK